MTKYDIYVMIDEDYSLSDGQAKKIMEVYVERKKTSLHSRQYNACEKTKGMEELHVNLEHAADYLIELFKSSKEPYSYSTTKLSKLLSIVAFVYAGKGKKLFDEKIYKYRSDSDLCCGVIIPELNFYISGNMSSLKSVKDNNSSIPLENFNFKEDDSLWELPVDVKNEIKKTFIRFGAYNPETLGKCINPIILHENVTLDNDEIDLLKIHEMLEDDYQKSSTDGNNNHGENDLIEYLFNQD